MGLQQQEGPFLGPLKEHSPEHTSVLDLWLQNGERRNFCPRPVGLCSGRPGTRKSLASVAPAGTSPSAVKWDDPKAT